MDALIEAATQHDESAKFKFDEFRTLMTYPKAGIAKSLLGVLEGDLFGDESSMPFHLRLQAHKRERLIGGLMSKNGDKRKESERMLGVFEAQAYRKQKMSEIGGRGGKEAKPGEALGKIQKGSQKGARASKTGRGDFTATGDADKLNAAEEPASGLKGWASVRSVMTPSRNTKKSGSDGMASVVQSVMRGRAEGPNSDVPIHSNILFKTTAASNKVMRFRPSDFFPPNMRSK